MAPTNPPERLLERWFPHTTTPFIANAPMLGFTDCHLAGAVTRAGGLGMFTPFEISLIAGRRDLTGSLDPVHKHMT
jgi:NAD(P)H-dependent flavin oxidoreductase YrpB (nitropropane dioxygenase family)